MDQFTSFLRGTTDGGGDDSPYSYAKMSVQDPAVVYGRKPMELKINKHPNKCEVCGELIPRKPDYKMGCATFHKVKFAPEQQDYIGMNEPVFSGRAVNDMMDAGVSGFVAHPVKSYLYWPTGMTGKGRYEAVPAAEFDCYWLEVTGRVDCDLQIFNNGEDSVCQGCGRFSPKRREKGHKVGYGRETPIPVLETWDGGDFCLYRNVNRGGYLCSRKIVELHARKSWKGFCFEGITSKIPMIIRPDRDPNWLEKYEKRVRDTYPHLV